MSRIPTKATIARKTPTSRTSQFERFKLVLPEECVTGGTTLAPAQKPRDYTKGLGPLGGNGRKSCSVKGKLQGSSDGRPGGAERSPGTEEPPGPVGTSGSDSTNEVALNGRADRIDDRADLGAQEDERDDRDDSDKREDQGVFGQTLAFLVTSDGEMSANNCVM